MDHGTAVVHTLKTAAHYVTFQPFLLCSKILVNIEPHDIYCVTTHLPRIRSGHWHRSLSVTQIFLIQHHVLQTRRMIQDYTPKLLNSINNIQAEVATHCFRGTWHQALIDT